MRRPCLRMVILAYRLRNHWRLTEGNSLDFSRRTFETRLRDPNLESRQFEYELTQIIGAGKGRPTNRLASRARWHLSARGDFHPTVMMIVELELSCHR